MLIGVNGFLDAGKDTIGSYLVEHKGFKRDAFADRMKLAVGALLGMTLEEIEKAKNGRALVIVSLADRTMDIPFRLLLKRFGTEGGRNIYGMDHWLNLVLSDPKVNENAGHFHYGKKIVITDVRFANEAKRIKDLNGYVINVTRPGCGPDEHISEQPLDDSLIDFYAKNDGTFAELYAQVEDFLSGIYQTEVNYGGEFYGK